MRQYDNTTRDDKVQRTLDRIALIWRLEEEEEDEQELKNVQEKSSLEIGAPDDPHEREADAVAQKVVNGEDAQAKIISASSGIQMKEDEGSLMAKSDGGTLTGTNQLQAKLDSSKGGGQTLDDTTKNEMGGKMGADLSDVKIHTDSRANEMSEGINAKAFTHGQDIYFKDGNFDTGSKDGKELLAHELAHTQQNKEGLQAKEIQRKPPEKKDDKNKQATSKPVSYTWTPSQTTATTNVTPAAVTTYPGHVITASESELLDVERQNQSGLLNSELGGLKEKNPQAPAPVADKNQLRHQELDKLLDNPSTADAAIESMNKEGAPGWNMLLFDAFNKAPDVQTRIRSKFSEWLKRPGSGFYNYILTVADDFTTVLSDYAITILNQNKMGSFVDKAAYISSISSKMAAAAGMFRELLPTGDKDLNYAGLIAGFEENVRDGQAKLKVYPMDRITTVGADVSDIISYLNMAQDMKKYLTPFFLSSGADAALLNHDSKTPAAPVTKKTTTPAPDAEAGRFTEEVSSQLTQIYLNAGYLGYGMDRYTFTMDGVNNEYNFETGKKDLKKQHDNLKKNIDDSMVSQLVNESLKIIQRIQEIKPYIGTLPGNEKIRDRLFIYEARYGALVMMTGTLRRTAASNPNAFYTFWSARMKEFTAVQSDLYCAGVAAMVFTAWNTYDTSWLAFVGKAMGINPLDPLAYLFNYTVEEQKLWLSAFYAACSETLANESYSPATKIQRISNLRKYQKYNDVMALAKTYGKLEEVFRIIATVIASIVIIILSIVTAGAVAGEFLAIIGTEVAGEVTVAGSTIVASLFEFGVNTLVFTAMSRNLNEIILGEQSETSFGEDLLWNAITFGALNGVGKIAGEIEKTASSLEKVMFKGGVAVAEVATMTLIDALHFTYQQSQLPEDKRTEFNTLSHLVQGAGMLIGIKAGMSVLAKLPKVNILEGDNPDLKKEMDAKELEFNAMKETLAERNMLPEEQQKFKDLTVEILNLRIRMIDGSIEKIQPKTDTKSSNKADSKKDSKTDAKTEEDKKKVAKLKQLKGDLKQKINEIKNGQDTTFNIRTSSTDPNLILFEGDPAGVKARLRAEHKGGTWKQSTLDPNTFTFTTPEGKQFNVIRTRTTREKNLDLDKMAAENGFKASDARSEFWKKAGQEETDLNFKSREKDEIVSEAITAGWRPGSENFPEIPLEKGKRLVKTGRYEEISQHFGKDTGQVKALKTLEEMPQEQLRNLLSQVKTVEQMNRLSGLVPDITQVKTVNLANEHYAEVNGKTIIDKARSIDNNQLAERVRDNPERAAYLEKVLSEINDTKIREQLQKELNELSDKGFDLFRQLNESGISGVTPLEQVKRASVGTEKGFDVQKTVDYFEAENLYNTLNTDYADLLATKNPGKGKKGKGLKYEQEIAEREQAYENRANDPSESRKKLEDLQKKLEFEQSLKTLADYTAEIGNRGNPYENPEANQQLKDAANKYIDNGGRDIYEFTKSLISDGGITKNKSKNKAVKESIDKAFYDAAKEKGIQIDTTKKATSGETNATRVGRDKAHKEYNPGENYETDRKTNRLSNGKIPDAIDYDNRIVRELKPNNRRQIKKGEEQVKAYAKQLQKDFKEGGKWKTVVDTYDILPNGEIKYNFGTPK